MSHRNYERTKYRQDNHDISRYQSGSIFSSLFIKKEKIHHGFSLRNFNN